MTKQTENPNDDTTTQLNEEILANDKSNHPMDRGLRPSFDALWHLRVLGVTQGDKEGNKTQVVVMDTPLDFEHPNLASAIDLVRMRDFSVFDEGVFVKHHDEIDNKDALGVQTVRNQLENSNDDQADEEKKEIAPKDPRMRLARNVPGAHGTAVSGLIGGRASSIKLRTAAHFRNEGNVEPSKLNTDFQLPYEGLNPNCTIIPVTLTAAPYPNMVLGALKYIEKLNPDIVVIAAAWAEKIDLERDEDEWNKVSKLLVTISKQAIVLCAAGNQSLEELVYPASLIEIEEEDNNIWAVAACDEIGEELTYSPSFNPKKRMIKTLSTEYPVFTRENVLRDIWAAPDAELNEADKEQESESTFPAKDIISLDPLGQQGYNPSPFRDGRRKRKGGRDGAKNKGLDEGQTHESVKIGEDLPFLEIGSIFTRFSGTSAAVAIAAGLISRVITPGKKPKVNPDAALQAELFNLENAKKIFAP